MRDHERGAACSCTSIVNVPRPNRIPPMHSEAPAKRGRPRRREPLARSYVAEWHSPTEPLCESSRGPWDLRLGRGSTLYRLDVIIAWLSPSTVRVPGGVMPQKPPGIPIPHDSGPVDSRRGLLLERGECPLTNSGVFRRPRGRLANAEYRTREYLTGREVERLMKAAHVKWFTRWGWHKCYRHRHARACAPR
jgi:hypothetical protein